MTDEYILGVSTF